MRQHDLKEPATPLEQQSAPWVRSPQGIVGAGLLAAANEFACDLLVMGAYSHSRLRQLILGGVTRHVLEHAAVPLIMHR